MRHFGTSLTERCMNFIFDLYGTLIDIKTDEEKRVLWENVACELGEDRSEAEKIRSEYRTLCSKYKTSDEQEIDLLGVFEDMLEAHGKKKSDGARLAEKFRELSTERIRLFDGVTEMLRSLKQSGAGVYLVSNAQACFTLPELEKIGLIPFFDGIVISSDVGFKKPSPHIFALALERFGLRADECVYVGNDMRDDIQGAYSAGLKTVYIQTEQSGKYDDSNMPRPTCTAENHAHLVEILLSFPK